MLPDLSVVWVIVFVLVLSILLDRLLLRPVTRIMKAREGAIGSARELAETSRARAQTAMDEFDQEMVPTRRLLERVPSEKGHWKPHPKSFALGHLAQLVSWMPGWVANTLRQTELNLMTAPGYSFEPTEKLLEMFDRNVQDARECLGQQRLPDSGRADQHDVGLVQLDVVLH